MVGPTEGAIHRLAKSLRPYGSMSPRAQEDTREMEVARAPEGVMKQYGSIDTCVEG